MFPNSTQLFTALTNHIICFTWLAGRGSTEVCSMPSAQSV